MKPFFHTFRYWTMALFLTSAAVVGHSGQAKETALSLPDNHAQVFTLKNGATVIVEKDASAPVASVQAWCATGSIHEDRWLGAGLSHILEHMLFKGTQTRKAGDIAREVQDQGGYINAYTSFDRTVYWIDVPATGVTQAVEIVADAMMNSTLPQEEYVKEQEVIRREFAMLFDNPDRMSSQLMLRTVFSESPFQHPVIGYLDVYNKLTQEDVWQYYKARYVPNNLTFVIVGDVDPEKIRGQLEAFFENYPRVALEPVYVASESPQIGKRTVHEEFPTELTRLSLAWRIPGLTHADTPALDLLGSILGEGRSSILNQEIREKKGLAHAVDAGMFSLQTDGVFVVSAVADPDKRDAIEKEALALIEKVKKDGVTASDLDRARNSLLSAQLSGLTTARGKASDLGSNWLLTKNTNFSKDYLDAIARVTAADLQRVAREYLREDRLNVTSLNPPGTLKNQDQVASQSAEIEVKKFTLANGLRLLVREDSRLPLVSIQAAFRGGLLAENKENNGITSLLSHTLLKGTKTRSAEQIAREIESVGGRMGSDSGNNSFNVSLELMKPDLSLGLQVLADVLINPTFPENEVELEKRAQLAGIKAEDEQITTVARNLVRERLFGNHPYALRNIGSVDSVMGLNPEQLRAFHSQLAVAKNGVISVFGDVKAEEVLKMVEKSFGVMKAGELALQNPPLPQPLSGPVLAEESRNKQQAVVMVGYQGIKAMDPNRPEMELIDEASNDLGSRFFNRIREKLGLAYFVGASQFAGLAPGCFVFYLGTDPAKVSDVQVHFLDEIKGLANNGLTEEELTRAKKKLLGAEAIRNQSNSALAAACAIDELMGLGYDHFKHRAVQIEKISLDDVKRVALKYFGPPHYVEAIVKPPAKTALPTAAEFINKKQEKNVTN